MIPAMPSYIVRAADRRAENELSSSHPYNPVSEIRGHALSRSAGLKRVGLWSVRIPPGRESFVYHRHRFEEEFIYALAGRALVEIDEERHEIGPGDFVGFPPGVAHHLLNPFAEDFLYLSGGENRDFEVADYPRLGKRMVRIGARADVYAVDAAEAMPGTEKL
jgi:uncharacterized cupin superfamily protein